jgi:hypothetical protein
MALMLVMGGCAAAYVYWENRPPSQIEFDPDRWQHPAGDYEVRWRMHEDLIHDYGLVGMSEEDVVALLGPDCQNCYHGPGEDLIYPMGMEHGIFAIDSVSLSLSVGEGGRVTSYRVVTH